MGRGRIEFRDLPIVEDAEVVELLLDRGRHTGELLEIVGHATRTGKCLEPKTLSLRRHRLGDRLSGRANVDARVALGTGNTIDRSLGYEIAIKRDGTAGVVIARDDIGYANRIAVGINDSGDRDVEALGLLNRDVFLVGIEHEQKIGQPTHVLDPAERAVELVALALQIEALFFGISAGLAELSISSSFFSREIDCEIVFQLVSVPPSQREFT